MKKGTKTILTAFIISLSVPVNAQNPFEEIGKEAKVLSYSNGIYPEIFENDTLVRIGSIVFNTNTNKIEYFVEEDTLYSEATLQPEVVSRWLSPDPLAGKYPSMSPYNFTANNPIIYVDTDGRDYEIYVDHISKTMTIRAIYYTETIEATERATAAANSINLSSGQYSLLTESGEKYEIHFELKVKEVKTGSTTDPAGSDPIGNSFDILPQYMMDAKRQKKGFEGYSDNGKYIDVVKNPSTGTENNDKHEELHTLGLSHKGIGKKGSTITAKVVGAILNFAGEVDKTSNIETDSKRKNSTVNESFRPNAKISSNDGAPVDLKGTIILTE